MCLLRYLAIPSLRWKHLPTKPSTLPQNDGRPQAVVEDVLGQDEHDLKSQQLARKLEQSLGRFSRLPTELITQILSYVVVVSNILHIYAPQNDTRKYGWRLSLWPNGQDWAGYVCRPIYASREIITEYMDTALLLVSQAMRQTTLDIMFAENHFVFTDGHELKNFAATLPTVVARIRSIHLFHRVDDYGHWNIRAETMAGTSALLESVRHDHLRFMQLISPEFEPLHEDGWVEKTCQLFNPLLAKFGCTVRWYWDFPDSRTVCNRASSRLIKGFTPTEPPLAPEKPLSNKKGIIAWST